MATITRNRLTRGLISCALLTLPVIACAQTRSYSLEDILVALRSAADEVQFATVSPNANRILDSLTNVFRSAHATGLSVEDLAAIAVRNRPRLRMIARTSPQLYLSWSQPSLDSALVFLRQIANSELTPILVEQRTKDEVTALLTPMSALHTAILQQAQAANTGKLRRYEVKYGPDSPRLNGVEVLLNYGAQWIPPFRSGDDGPSPFEVIATYSTSNLTATDNARDKLVARVVAATHIGIRHYQFGDGWGEGGALSRFFKPRNMSLGMMWMSARDNPLTTPFRGPQRIGGFLDWGSARAGFVGGKEWRVIVGAGKHIIPYLF